MEFTNENLNFELLCRHNAVIKRDAVCVEIFRGSDARKNKHKVSEIKIPIDQAKQSFEIGEWFSLVCNKELELNIPLVTYYEN